MMTICNAPMASMFIKHGICPTCGKETDTLIETFEWYAPEAVCLGCGDAWNEDGLRARPFERNWRQRRIEQAQQRYTAYLKRTVNDARA